MKPSSIRENEDGVTLVFVAVVLVGLLAMTAFAIDFGRMWEERRQLQNGADAAALAIAEDCARGLCDGSYDEYVVADDYADDNARDRLADAWRVDLDLDAQTVTVYNRTEDPGGDNKFDMLFAGAVGFDGFTVGAEATVAWGGLASPVSTIPIIISQCEYDRPYWEGGAGGSADDGPHRFREPRPGADTPVLPWLEPYPAWYTANGPYDMDQDGEVDTYPVPVVLTFHDGGTTDDCAAQAGQDTDGDGKLSGGFGWLDIDDTADQPCVTQVFGVYDPDSGEYGWAGEDPGASPSTGCDAADLEDLLLGPDGSGSLVFIPFFNDENDLNGSNGEYKIAGYGAFWIVGYNFGSGQYQAYADPLTKAPCRPGGLRPLGWTSGNDDRCLAGYFVDVVYNGPGDIGGTGYGITVIKFTG
jgi:hypothetical protein